MLPGSLPFPEPPTRTIAHAKGVLVKDEEEEDDEDAHDEIDDSTRGQSLTPTSYSLLSLPTMEEWLVGCDCSWIDESGVVPDGQACKRHRVNLGCFQFDSIVHHPIIDSSATNDGGDCG